VSNIPNLTSSASARTIDIIAEAKGRVTERRMRESIHDAEIDGWNQAVRACIRVISDREEGKPIGPWTRETLRQIDDLRIKPEPET
jgi:hypothetical protein